MILALVQDSQLEEDTTELWGSGSILFLDLGSGWLHGCIHFVKIHVAIASWYVCNTCYI